MDALTELSLFTGFGGGLLATQHLLRWRTVCYVEWDKYAVEVLKARIRDGYLHDAPIWDDAFTFDGRPWAGLVDVVSAGFPCQPFSVAGKGLAENDPRNGWPATIRIIREVRPRIAWLENVPGLLAKSYFGTILGELSEAGYRVRWDCVSAQEVGAPHLRERLWIIAYAPGFDGWVPAIAGKQGEAVLSDRDGKARIMADTDGKRLQELNIPAVRDEQGFFGWGVDEGNVSNTNNPAPTRQRKHRRKVHAGSEASRSDSSGCEEWWAVEPDVGRVADGVAFRVDRLRGIGNGQVPDVVEKAWHLLTGA